MWIHGIVHCLVFQWPVTLPLIRDDEVISNCLEAGECWSGLLECHSKPLLVSTFPLVRFSMQLLDQAHHLYISTGCDWKQLYSPSFNPIYGVPAAHHEGCIFNSWSTWVTCNASVRTRVQLWGCDRLHSQPYIVHTFRLHFQNVANSHANNSGTHLRGGPWPTQIQYLD